METSVSKKRGSGLRSFIFFALAALSVPALGQLLSPIVDQLGQSAAHRLVLADVEKLQSTLSSAPSEVPEKMVPAKSGPTLAFTWLRDSAVDVGYKVRVGQDLCTTLASEATDLPRGWTLSCSTQPDTAGHFWAQLHTPLEAPRA